MVDVPEMRRAKGRTGKEPGNDSFTVNYSQVAGEEHIFE